MSSSMELRIEIMIVGEDGKEIEFSTGRFPDPC